MDFKIEDKNQGSELYFGAQGKENHTQLDINFTVIDKQGVQHDFNLDFDDLFYVGTYINRETGFEVFDLREIEKMKKVHDEAWIEYRAKSGL